MFCSRNGTDVNGSRLVIGKENRYPSDSHPYIIAGWGQGLRGKRSDDATMLLLRLRHYGTSTR